MSGATHTPGPWEVRASHDTVDFGIIARDEKADGGWVVIAEAFSEIRHAGERAPEALHNARLMSAAPELFQAAEQFLASVKDGNAGDLIDYYADIFGEAVAKATGSPS